MQLPLPPQHFRVIYLSRWQLVSLNVQLKLATLQQCNDRKTCGAPLFSPGGDESCICVHRLSIITHQPVNNWAASLFCRRSGSRSGRPSFPTHSSSSSPSRTINLAGTCMSLHVYSTGSFLPQLSHSVYRSVHRSSPTFPQRTSLMSDNIVRADFKDVEGGKVQQNHIMLSGKPLCTRLRVYKSPLNITTTIQHQEYKLLQMLLVGTEWSRSSFEGFKASLQKPAVACWAWCTPGLVC